VGTELADTVPEISRADLIAAMRAGRVTVVDVLSPESFAAAHLPDAVNLPLADIRRCANVVLPDRMAQVIVYCGGPT
jgi:rhodanese-related sulfurtransferase